MAKKKIVNKRAKAGSGKRHDKGAPTIGSELQKAAENPEPETEPETENENADD